MSRLYVGNVPSTLKTEELRSLFEDCGKIKYFNIQEGSGYMVRKIIFLTKKKKNFFRNMKLQKQQKKQ